MTKLLTVPLIGAVYLVAFPVIGFAVIASALVRRLSMAVAGGAADLAATMAPGFSPGEAHLTGKPGSEEAGAGEGAPELEGLAKEIDARKGERR